MGEAVQLGAAAVEVVDVAEFAMDSVRTARTRGTNRAIETQKGAVFMVASVGKEINVSETRRSINIQSGALTTNGPAYLYIGRKG
jgi:hypothetical protein